MVTTRSKKKKEAIKKGHVNPNDASNWPDQPKTASEMDVWMQTTRKSLLAWLAHTKEAAHSSETKQILETKKADIKFDTTWTDTWLPQTDYDTGKIYDDKIQKKMVRQMRGKMTSMNNLHAAKNTHESDEDFRYAQASWEDFLYFQNEWNRRRYLKHEKHYDPSETKAEYLEKARIAEMQDSDNRREEHYLNWRDHMIDLMDLHKVGDRNRVPEMLGTSNLHQYSSSVRELYRDKVKTSEREKNREKERKCSLKKAYPRHDFTIDESAFKKESKKNGFLEDPITNLPKGHRYHHGATERSTDHPTSFEQHAWGRTIKEFRSYVSDKVDQETLEKIVDPWTRYKKTKLRQIIPGFLLDLDANGEIKGRDRDGTWYGMEMNQEIDIETYDLDESGQRIELHAEDGVRYVQTRIYTAISEVEDEYEHPGRRDNAAGSHRDPAEFSDISSNRYSDIDSNILSSLQSLVDSESEDDSDDENDLFTMSYLEGSRNKSSKLTKKGSILDEQYASFEPNPISIPISVATLPRIIYEATPGNKRLREIDEQETGTPGKIAKTS